MSWLSDRTVAHLRGVADQPDLGEGRYEILAPIARGGMGQVYRARDRELGRDVALKVLSAVRLGRGARRRMVREARIIARLEHPGIVPVHDVGTLPDGRVYYAMKLVRGERLDAHARAHPDLGGLLRVFERVCEAVGFAHAHGVIHRDLKPENVMVGPFGEVLVMDWGVAKVLDEAAWEGLEEEEEEREGGDRVNAGRDADSENRTGVRVGERTPAGDRASSPAAGSARAVDSVGGEDPVGPSPARSPRGATSEASGAGTEPGTVLGTPGYMAPEQAEGRVDLVDRRSDVFALGVLLRGLVEAGGGTTPRPLRSLIAKACAPDPAARYESVETLAADVSSFLSGHTVSAHRETLAERVGRAIVRHRTPILILLAYVVIRLVILLVARV